MMSLVEKYFSQDLQNAEVSALSEMLDSSDEAVDQFIALAEKKYLATGLPKPRWDDRQGPDESGSSPSAKSWLTVLVMALGLGVGSWSLLQKDSKPAKAAWMQTALSESKGGFKEVEPRRVVKNSQSQKQRASTQVLAPPASKAESFRDGDSLGVVVDQDAAGPAIVRVLDLHGQLVRFMYEGHLDKGSWRFVWDGADNQGRKLKAGAYKIEVSSGGEVHRLKVELQ